jgi:hypothetical protein
VNLSQLAITLGVLGLGTWAAVRLIGPFASALAERLRHRPPAGSDDTATAELRAELEAMQERLDFLERAIAGGRAASPAALPRRVEGPPPSDVTTPV